MLIDDKQQKLLENNAKNKAEKELQEQRIKQLEDAAKSADQAAKEAEEKLNQMKHASLWQRITKSWD